MSTGTAHHCATLTPCVSSPWPLDFCSWFSSKPSLQMSLPMRLGEIKAQCPLNLPPFVSLLPRSLFHSWSGTRGPILSLASTCNWSSLPQCSHLLRPPIKFSFHCFIFGSQAGLDVPPTHWQGQHTSPSPSAPFPLQHPLSRVTAEVTRRSRLVSPYISLTGYTALLTLLSGR